MPKRIELKYPADKNPELEQIMEAAVAVSNVSGGRAVLVKRSIDARSKTPYFIYSIDVYSASEEINSPIGFALQNVANAPEVHVIGLGPAGMFAAVQLIELGLKPVLLERGKDVRRRRFDLAKLIKDHTVDPDSNYCFGEGGAGTYSDGKLYTRSSKRGPVQKVLASLIEFGATEQIIWDAHPHIGTNKLPAIMERYREAIMQAGGEIHFDCRVVDFVLESDKIRAIKTADGRQISVAHLILATGHSARDIFELLHKRNMEIAAKPFALGVRMEHHQSLIDQIQYHCEVRPESLPAASYSLVEQIRNRGVFSFCMCPGGIIAPAATAPGEIVVNGWSPSKRNGAFANSGFVVSVDENDFKPYAKYGPLAAMKYQEHWEKMAFATQNNLVAPAQRIEDFVQNKSSSGLPECSYLPGIASRKIDEVLSAEVTSRIRDAFVVLGKKMKGFRSNEAIIVGVESRTSSPVKIPRHKEMLHHTQYGNLYPTGEGAGYAGGIMSAALDGMRVANAIFQAIKEGR